VIPISTQFDVAHLMPRGARRLDFSSHVKAQVRALKTRFERRNALIEVVRDAHASLDPQTVAAWLVRQADEWIPAPCWAVIAPDINGQLTVLADKGLLPTLGPSVWAVADWVFVEGGELLSADLSKDKRTQAGPVAGTAIGLPLVCRSRPVGVLIGLDPMPSATTPSLGAAAAVIRSCARETDVVARFGGDEFSVILPDTGREGAVFVAERICDRLRAFKFLKADGLAVHLTASVGIATLPDVTTSAEELLRAADRAMYRVKDTGKNGIHVAEKGS
jgi:hypothetical protein